MEKTDRVSTIISIGLAHLIALILFSLLVTLVWNAMATCFGRCN